MLWYRNLHVYSSWWVIRNLVTRPQRSFSPSPDAVGKLPPLIFCLLDQLVQDFAPVHVSQWQSLPRLSWRCLWVRSGVDLIRCRNHKYNVYGRNYIPYSSSSISKTGMVRNLPATTSISAVPGLADSEWNSKGMCPSLLGLQSSRVISFIFY